MSFSPLKPPKMTTKPKLSAAAPVRVSRLTGRFEYVKLMILREKMPSWLQFDVEDKAVAKVDILLGAGEAVGQIKLCKGGDFIARKLPTKSIRGATLCPIVFLLSPFAGAPPAAHSALPCGFLVDDDENLLITLPSIYFKKEREDWEKTRIACMTPNSGLAKRP